MANVGDLVRLEADGPGGLSMVGILLEERLSRGVLGTGPAMVIWQVLMPNGVFTHLREEGWKLEVLSEAG
jgi:hypothetical protein